MSRSHPPHPQMPSAPADAEAFAIEIDPSLIDEALAAVSRPRGEHAGQAPEGGVEISLDEAPRAETKDDDKTARLIIRTREQEQTIARLQRELKQATDARDAADRQVREARQAIRDQAQEFERFRVRARRDAEEAERRGEEKVLRPLADIYDNVERAWLHAVADPAQLLHGLQIIVEQFKRLLARVGFERIEADRGMLFDPEVHEAVLHVRDDEVLPGTIVHEVHAGFRLRGRLFRPARVTVSAPPPDSGD